ncbi:MAG: hypothetical protein KJ069_16145 [Anaerolineae bacterium]|nr:hypothetical protein [Anaerolineae bacterium]
MEDKRISNQHQPQVDAAVARKLVDMAGAGVELVDRYAAVPVPAADSEVLQAFAAALLATYLNSETSLQSKIQAFSLTVRAVYGYGRACAESAEG